MRRGLERRELFLELGDARGQSVPLGLERLAVARAHHVLRAEIKLCTSVSRRDLFSKAVRLSL